MGSTLLLVVVIVTALAFDFTNGFHDTANAMATSIATRALRPRVAVALSAVLNLAGAFISLKVATTISSGIVASSLITLNALLAALIGASVWNLVTWYFGPGAWELFSPTGLSSSGLPVSPSPEGMGAAAR